MKKYILLVLCVLLYTDDTRCRLDKHGHLKKTYGKHASQTGDSRQAIPLAVVQSGALGDMAVSKEKKKQDNETINTKPLCIELYPNCPDFLIEQAKIDKKLKQDGSNFNVTESSYNTSVASALDNNKTTVTFNKTIHLLQNATETKINQPDYEPGLGQLGDKSSNKLIYVAPTKNITESNENITTPNTLEVASFNTTNIANKTITIDDENKKQNFINKTVIPENITELIRYDNDTLLEKLDNNTLLDKRDNNTLLNKRVVLTLPHSYYAYKHPFAVTKERTSKKEDTDENQRILLGPLDDLPDNLNGNGPQEKKRKDLDGLKLAKAQSENTMKEKKKKQHPKQKEREKRQTYNFDLNRPQNNPFDFAMDSERFERNYDYGDLNRHLENKLRSSPGHAYTEQYIKKHSPTNRYMPNQDFDKNRLFSNFIANEEPPKAARASIQESEFPGIPDNRFNFDQQLYNGSPVKNYDNFVEHEAANLNHGFTPRIGTAEYGNVDGIFNSENQPIGPAILNEAIYKPENFLESSIQKILSDNTGLQAHVPTEEMRSLAQKITSPTSLAEFRSKQIDSSGPPYLFDSDELAARGAIPAPPENQLLAARMLRDKRIQGLLNQYDAQTKTLAALYHNNREDNVETNNQVITGNPVSRSYQPQVQNYEQIQNAPRQENEMLSDPSDSRLRESNYGHEEVSRNDMNNNKDDQEILQRDRMNNNRENLEAVQRDRMNNNRGDLEAVQRDRMYRSREDSQSEEYSQNQDENERKEKIEDIMKERQEEENQRNALVHSNLIKEFIKFFAYRNNVTPRNSEVFSPSKIFPLMVNQNNFNGMQPAVPQASFQQPINPYGFTGIPRDSLPTSTSYNEQLIKKSKQVFPTLAETTKTSAFSPLMMTSANMFGGTTNKPNDNSITNQQGIVMLMVTSPLEKETEGEEVKKEVVEHKELTKDGVTRTSSNVTDDDRDFSINLKKAADFVLGNAVKEGNISTVQRDEIQHKLQHLLDNKYKNKTRGEIRASTRASIPKAYNKYCEDTMNDCNEFKAGGVCPFMRTFMKGTCRKSCDECSEKQYEEFSKLKIDEFILKKSKNIEKAPTLKRSGEKPNKPVVEQQKVNHVVGTAPKRIKAPSDAVMYLSFEKASRDGVIEDESTNKNNAMLENGAQVSPRVLGTCGRAAELNEGSVSWSGDEFKRKPDMAISISMWVKVRKGGVINWFANGKKGDKMFYTRTKGTVVPPKVWTHVAGTFDSSTGLARIYINGNLEQEQQQNRGQKLAKNWLVNGIGSNFGDDSLHYVDEVFIYDRALSNSEIRTLFNRCSFNRMVLHFGFQKGNKTNISDQSGLENNAILIGGATQRENCDRCGYCLDLSRGPDPTMKIQQISEKQLPRFKISIAVWVSLNSTKGVHNIFTTESSEGNIGYRLQVVHGKIRWAIGTDTIPVIFDNMTRAEVVPEALWTHIIATYNNENGVTKIYANSMLKFKDIVPENKRTYLPNNWDNDASIGDRTLRGYLDELIMYNWELDDSEALYVRNYCADHPKLVRFTVRVPLTKKTVVPRAETKRSSILPKRNDNKVWWYLYMKLLNEKLGKSKKSQIKTNITDRSSKPIKSMKVKSAEVKVYTKKDTVEQATKQKLRELALEPSEAFALLKKK